MTNVEQGLEPTVALYILKALYAEGIRHVFFVPGAMIDYFTPNYATVGITPIIATHEAAAAYMADGYARATRNFGVAMGIGGPGITNMATAIAAAYSDRSPILIIAGNIPLYWEGQGTFQDSSATGIDDRRVLQPMTAFAQVISDKILLETTIRKAIKAMKGIENRPAFLSIPYNIQEDPCVADYAPIAVYDPPRILDTETAKTILPLLKNTTKIVILVGNGANWSQAGAEIQAFTEQYSIPIVTTMRAKGLVAEDTPMALGVFGLGGSLWANQVIMGSQHSEEGAEVLLVLGATLNENNTHSWSALFKPSKALVRVDINPNNLFGKEFADQLVMGDIRTFMHWLNEQREMYHTELMATKATRETWLATIRATPYYDPPAARVSDAVPIHPARIIADLRKVAPRNTVLIVDSGAHTFFTGHNWTSYAPNEFLFLSTTGPMGYGVAMTIGAWMARPQQPHVAVVGDGSLLMHGMEIHTAVRFKVPIVIVVINNGALANVYLRARNMGEAAIRLAEVNPTQDWAAFCKTLGGDGIVVEKPSELEAAFQQAFQTVDRPFLVDVRCAKNVDTPNTQEYTL